MKKIRKGFTLVELLIVIAILATLTATMMMSMQGATAKAKAATIAANLDLCRTAANIYYGASMDNGAISKDTADQVLSRQMKQGWTSMKGTAGDTILYGASGEGPTNWVASVDFTAEAESKDIANALKKIRNYRGITTSGAKIKLYLLTGSADVDN